MSYVKEAAALGAKAYDLTLDRLERAVSSKNLENLSVLHNQLVAMADKHAVDNLNWKPGHQCELGCAYCCHLNVGVTVPELFNLWDCMPDRSRKDVLEKLKALGKAAHDDERCRNRTPCVFLNKPTNGRGICSIYEHRPLTCRAMFGTDKKACEEAFGVPDAMMGHPVAPRSGIYCIELGCMGACLELGHTPFALNLDTALLIVLQASKPEDLFRDWLTGFESAFRAAKQSQPPSPKMVAQLCNVMREMIL